MEEYPGIAYFAIIIQHEEGAGVVPSPLIFQGTKMIIMTSQLPSGHKYRFESITVKPMFFAQVLEYEENCPKDDIEKYYFDYCVVKGDDPNVDELLVPDLEFVVFFKKALTIAREATFTASLTCPECGSKYSHRISVPKDVHYSPLDPKLVDGFGIKVGNEFHQVRIPTMREFLQVLGNYRRFRKLSDMKIIKLIALFKDATLYPNKYEELIVNAVYEDISSLVMLGELCYESVDPVVSYCPACNRDIVEPSKKRGTVIDLSGLITNFFRLIVENNRASDYQILS